MSDDEVKKARERRARERERLARDEAIERAEKAANERWKLCAMEAILWCAERYYDFISDAVWARLDQLTDHQPREARALGGLLRRAKKHGWIVNTTVRRQSLRPGCHLNEVTVWRSLLYVAEPEQQELTL